MDGAYKLIKLSRGLVAAVSPEDYERVNEHNWWPTSRNGHIGSVITSIEGRCTTLGRFILKLLFKEEAIEINYWNYNAFDNRRCNLRQCTRSENLYNHRKTKYNSNSSYSTKYIGVYACRGKFNAYIQLDGKQMHLGTFNSAAVAAYARDAAARKYHGKFASLNFPYPEEFLPSIPPELLNQILLLANWKVHRAHKIQRGIK